MERCEIEEDRMSYKHFINLSCEFLPCHDLRDGTLASSVTAPLPPLLPGRILDPASG